MCRLVSPQFSRAVNQRPLRPAIHAPFATGSRRDIFWPPISKTNHTLLVGDCSDPSKKRNCACGRGVALESQVYCYSSLPIVLRAGAQLFSGGVENPDRLTRASLYILRRHRGAGHDLHLHQAHNCSVKGITKAVCFNTHKADYRLNFVSLI